MIDLNELFLYAKVVEHSGFAAAGRALNMPKSTLSRRVNQLETRLGVRLIQRSTRQFQVTDIGQSYYRHCVAMMAEAESAEDLIEQNRSEPRGMVRLSCSTPLLNYWMAPRLGRFMAHYPAVELYVKSYNRRVDIISEGFDIALGLSFPPLDDSELVMKVLGPSPQMLVASPAFIQRHGPLRTPADLAGLPSVAWANAGQANHWWQLRNASGATAQVTLAPRLLSDDISVLKSAVLEGAGIANLPCTVVRDELASGQLQRLLEDWEPTGGVITAVFPSRRGLRPSVRTLIDFLATSFVQERDS